MQIGHYNWNGLCRSNPERLQKWPLSMWKMIVLRGMSDMWCSQTRTIENLMKPNVAFYNMGTPNLFMYSLLWYLLQLYIYSRFITHDFGSCKDALSNTFSQSAYWAPSRVQFSTSLVVNNSITILLCEGLLDTKWRCRSTWSWSATMPFIFKTQTCSFEYGGAHGSGIGVMNFISRGAIIQISSHWLHLH